MLFDPRYRNDVRKRRQSDCILQVLTFLTLQAVPPTPSQLATPATANSRTYNDMIAIPQLVHEALTTCDVDVRANLLQNVVVVGGGSLLPGFVDRLNFELSVMFPGVRFHLLTRSSGGIHADQARNPSDAIAKGSDPRLGSPDGAPLFVVARRLDPRLARNIPPALDLKGRVGGVWAKHCRPEVQVGRGDAALRARFVSPESRLITRCDVPSKSPNSQASGVRRLRPGAVVVRDAR